jgi:predicted MPP superfamily phosphohydrolase
MPAALATDHPHQDSLLPIVAILIALLAILWAVVGVALAPLLPGGWWAVLGVAGVVTVLPLVSIVRLRLRGGYPGRWVRLLVMRPFWYATLALLLLAPLGLVGMLGGALTGMAVAAEQWTLAVGAALLVLLMLAGYLGSRRLVVRRLTVPVAGLPAQFDGLTIVQISDLHVGPHTPRRFLARVTARVREAEPDLIAVTGDMVDDFARDVDDYAVAFGDLTAPFGVFAIPGNHDVYAGWPAVRERLERLPLRVLVNDVQLLHRDGATLAIVGIGDPAASHGGTAAGGPEPDSALALVPSGVCAIALAHNPLLWPVLARGGVALTLSGHTHNGQFAIPALGWSLASPFLDHVAGLYREECSRLYINPGTNYWGIPFRLGTPAEVTVIVLTGDDGR